MKEIVRAMKKAGGELSWARFVTALVFALLLPIMKPPSDWPGIVREAAIVLLFVGVAFLTELLERRYLRRVSHRLSDAGARSGAQHRGH